MTEDDLFQLVENILQTEGNVSQRGKSLGTQSLFKRVNERLAQQGKEALSLETFLMFRSHLIDRGLLLRGPGYGGSTILPPPSALPPPAASSKAPETFCSEVPLVDQGDFIVREERVLYEPAMEIISRVWTNEYGYDLVAAKQTADQGARPTGKWSRPDLVIAVKKSFPYLPRTYVDLITFEVKQQQWDITSVYETRAHRRFANRSYLILPVQEEEESDELRRLLDEAAKLEVGVILVNAVDNQGNLLLERFRDYNSWDERLKAPRNEPDPELMNAFLSKQVDENFRASYLSCFKLAN